MSCMVRSYACMCGILWISIWTAGSCGGCRTDSREKECGVVDAGGPMPGDVSSGEI